MRPKTGLIAIGERVVFDKKARIFVPPVERNIGLVFQDSRLFPHMSVRDNLLFGWRRSKVKAAQAEIDHVIALMNLGALLGRSPRNLSGGEKSRVALGRALLSSPDLLLLDEPLAALDQQRRDEILPYLENLAREAQLPMLYVSHTLDDVARLADEIVLMESGRVLQQGSVFALLPQIAPEGGGGPSAVLDTQVRENRKDGLTALAFDGGELLVRGRNLAVGTRTRARIRAEDVMLALERPSAISANNILPVSIVAVQYPNETDADIELACGSAKLVARITRASTQRLNIEPGGAAFAVVKSVQFERQGGIAPRD
jgi:molybdate transport system ATP-binding protein